MYVCMFINVYIYELETRLYKIFNSIVGIIYFLNNKS